MESVQFLAGGGEMGERIHAYDWSSTSVGAIETWPQSLKTTLSIIINSNFPMFLWWGDDLVQFYNDAYRKILGVDGRHPGALGQTAEKCWPEVWNSISPLIDQVTKKGESVYIEDLMLPLYRNGKMGDAYWTFGYSPVKDEAEKVAGVIVVCTENTDRVKDYAKLKESEDLLSFAIESAELATWDLNPITNKFTGNDRLKEWFGLPKEAEIDLPDAVNTIAEKDREAVAEAISKALQYPGEKYEIEYTIVNSKTKTERTVVAKGKAWFNEDKIAYRFNGTLQDITDKLEIRKAEVEKENYFRRLTDAVPAIIWITRADGYCTFLNKNWYDHTGQTKEEAEGFGWLNATHPDDKEEAGRAFLEANKNQEYFSVAYRLKNKNGEYRWVMDSATPKFDDNGEYEGFVGTVVDIHEQKLAEVQIKESEQRFRTLIASAPIAIGLFVGRDLVIENQNEIFNQIVGKGDVTGWKLIEAMPELVTEGQPFLQILDDVFTSGKMFQTFGTQVKIVQNGVLTYNYYDFTYTPIFDSQGKVYAILDIAIDVTENVLAQKRIEESEINLRNTISKAPVAMCIFKGKEHTVEIANDKMLELWGKTTSQVSGKPIIEGLPEIVGQGFEALLDSVFETGKTINANEVPVNLPREENLKLIYVDFVYEAFRESDGSISGIMAVAIDVTQQVLARKKIEEAEEKARLAIESADLGSYEVDLLTNEMSTSERFDEIWGGHSTFRSELASYIHPEDLPIRNEAHKKSIESGVLEYETRLLRKDKSIRWARVKGKLIYDENKTPIALIGVVQDITEQKQFAEQLTKLVKERTLELHRSNEDLLQFAHVASHDLKEPVRKIKIFSSMLQSDYGELLPERGMKYLNKVHNATDRMFSMIEGVLAYSEFTSAEQKNEIIYLDKIIDNIESDLELLIQQKNATIIRENLPEIEGADVLIHQLFYNLINNALKFSKSDVPTVIEINSEDDTSTDGDEMVKITVSDNGIGIDPSFSEKIFDVFSRLNAKDDYEGTGLGLALCKKIVERHHGTISATGIRGEKAIFTILLPKKQLLEIE
ncbi:PAS domain S-box protein [Flavobacterium qiangtangense]|uniref:histidine kinase n=1 Tax=Flavobacterium qiangtangense TaxID=1442595 RepID=A0ABW1PNK5_9FLAO